MAGERRPGYALPTLYAGVEVFIKSIKQEGVVVEAAGAMCRVRIEKGPTQGQILPVRTIELRVLPPRRPPTRRSDDSRRKVDPASERVRGTVKWFNDAKGFGFIAPDSAGEEVFVHRTQVPAGGAWKLVKGLRVEFEVRVGSKGLKAFNLREIRDPRESASRLPTERGDATLGGQDPAAYSWYCASAPSASRFSPGPASLTTRSRNAAIALRCAAVKPPMRSSCHLASFPFTGATA